MTKVELMNLAGKKVQVTYLNGETEDGILQYVDEFSEKHGYRKVDYFYLAENPYSNMCFKVSHLKKVKQI